MAVPSPQPSPTQSFFSALDGFGPEAATTGEDALAAVGEEEPVDDPYADDGNDFGDDYEV